MVATATSITATLTVQNPTAFGPTPLQVFTPGGGGSIDVILTQPTPVITELVPDNGLAGTRIEIKGTGFGTKTGSNLVTFADPTASRLASTVILDRNKSLNLNGELSILVDAPVNVAAGPLTVEVGGVTSSGVLFKVPTLTSMTSNALTGIPANTSLRSANVGQTVPVQGEWFFSDTKVIFPSTTDAGSASTVSATLAAVSATQMSAQVTVPMGATTGSVTTNGQGDVPLQIIPTLDTYSLPTGQELQPGVVVTLMGNGFKEGVTTVTFAGASGSIPADDVTGSNDTLTVTAPPGTIEGLVTVTTDGGTSNSLAIVVPRLTGIVSTVTNGIPADPTVPASNTGTSTPQIQGSGFTSSTRVMFPTLSSDGVSGTATVIPANINVDGKTANVAVPSDATTGLVRVNGPGSALLQIVPFIHAIALSAGAVLQPGTVATINGSGFMEGSTTVTFTGASAPVPVLDVQSTISQLGTIPNSILTVEVPPGASPGPISVTTPGGTSNGLQLAIPELQAVNGTAEQGSPADPILPSANVRQGVQVVSTEISTTGFKINFTSSDEAGVLGTTPGNLVQIVPSGTRGFVVVPINATTGPVTSELHGLGTGSALLQIVPTVRLLSIPTGAAFLPGTTVTIEGTGFQPGGTTVTFPGAAGPVQATDVFASNQTLTVVVPPGATIGIYTVTTSGGTSNDGFIGSLQTIVAVAAQGVPADPALPSANPAQTIQLQGLGFNSDTQVIFPTRSGSGTLSTKSVPVVSVNTDGTLVTAIVPLGATTGQISLNGLGSAMLQIVPIVASLDIPLRTRFEPGVEATLGGNGFQAGLTSVVFPGSRVSVTPTNVSGSNSALTVGIPSGVTSGSVIVTTDGGTSNGFPLPVLQSIDPVPTLGTPTDPTLPSANTGQKIRLRGLDFQFNKTRAIFEIPDGSGGILLASVLPNPQDFSSDGTNVLVAVPAGTTTGTVSVNGVGTVPLQIIPTINTFSLPAGEIFVPGVILTLKGDGFVPGATEVTFPGIANSVQPTSVFALVQDPGGLFGLTVTVPAGALGGGIPITTPGGTSNSLSIFSPADLLGITAVAGQGTPTNPAQPSANIGQTIQLQGADFAAGTQAVFPSTSDTGIPGVVIEPVTSIGSNGTTAAATVPTLATTGPVNTGRSTTVDLQIVPTITGLTLPQGETLRPGVLATLDGSGFKEVDTFVAFPGAAQPVPASVQNGNDTLTVVVPAGVTGGGLTVITDGGTSDNFVVAGLQGIQAVATEGTPADPSAASANVLQTIQLQGAGFSASTQVVFPTINSVGIPGTLNVTVFSASSDGSTASVMVPIEATTGLVSVGGITNVLLQIVPNLDSVFSLTSFPFGAPIEAGVILSIEGKGFKEGLTTVTFPGVANPVPTVDVLDRPISQGFSQVNALLKVQVPSGVLPGSITVITDGGTSTGLPIPVLNAINATAALGVPADPTRPSTNVADIGGSTTIELQGSFLTNTLDVIFPTINANGMLGTKPDFIQASADGTTGFPTVLADTTTGFVQINGLGSAFLQIVPTVTGLIVPFGQVFQPGVEVTLEGSGFKEVATTVMFTGASGPVSATNVLDTPSFPLSNNGLTVTVPPGTTAGPVTVTTDGGTSNSLLLPTLQGINATATQGIPADTSLPSANTGQTIQIQGAGLVPTTQIFFPTISDTGLPGTTFGQLLNINAAGTTANVIIPNTGNIITGPVTINGIGSADLQIVPTVSSFSLPSGANYEPGAELTLTGMGYVEGGTPVNFPGVSTPVAATDVFTQGRQLRVTVPTGALDGDLTVTTAGGTSNTLFVSKPTLQAILSTALNGTPLDPSVPSANVGTQIRIQGLNLTSQTPAQFTTTSETGTQGTESVLVVPLSTNNEALVFVPALATTGSLTIGSTSLPLQIVPTVSSIAVTGGGDIRTGVEVSISGGGFKVGATIVTFPGVPTPVPGTANGGCPINCLNHVVTANVPSGVTGGSLTVTTDGGTSKSFDVPELLAVIGTATSGVPADPTLPSAVQGQQIQVQGTGLQNGDKLVLVTSAGNAPLVLIGVASDGTSATLPIPNFANVTTGSLHLERAAVGSSFLQVVPALTDFSLPVGQAFGPGVLLTLDGSGFKDGATTVSFAGTSSPVPAVSVVPQGNQLTVLVPVGAIDGLVTVTTNGGTSNSLLVGTPTLTTIAATAVRGTPADPSQSSANRGQVMTLSGATLTAHTHILIPVFDSQTGAVAPIPFSPESVSADGMAATKVLTSRMVTGQVTVQDSRTGVGIGSAVLQVVPTVDRILGSLIAGNTITVEGSGFEPNSTQVQLPGVAQPVNADSASIIQSQGAQASVLVPAGVTPTGDVTVTTNGGTSNVFTAGLAVLSTIVSTASEGTPAAPSQPSANVGDTIQLQGSGFVLGVDARFQSAIGDRIVPLNNVSADGTQAFVSVPPRAITGPVFVEQSSVVLQVVPRIGFIQPPPGGLVPGEFFAIAGDGFEQGATTVTFPGVAIPSPATLFSGSNETFLSIEVPPGVTLPTPGNPESLTVNTNGGSSAPFLFSDPVLSGTTATATLGTPADPTQPSANVQQVITLHGTDFLPMSTQATFTDFFAFDTASPESVSSDGLSLTVLVPPGTLTGPMGVRDSVSGLGQGQVNLQIVPTVTSASGTLVAGNSITVVGQGYSRVLTQVKFPGVPQPVNASFVDFNGNVASVTVPAGVDLTGALTVISAGGESNPFPLSSVTP